MFYGILTFASCFSGDLHGASVAAPSKLPFQHELEVFRSGLNLPISAKAEQISMPDRTLKIRAKKSGENSAIEPLQLVIGSREDDVSLMANRLARPGKVNELSTYFFQAIRGAPPLKPGSASRMVTIDKAGFDLIEPEAFAALFARTHYKLQVDGQALNSQTSLKKKFFDQLKPYFSERERTELLTRLRRGASLAVDSLLLPEFARKMVKRYIVYRGPNCFHAALAFQSPLFTRSSLVNIKEEEGYHRAMINYDELWRAISSNFYEVDPSKVDLKYGDMLVFFDVPKKLPATIDYRWIRHASTYLFSGYTFSKGSKSPNTPYAVRTIAEEWSTWQKYSKNLGVKVYRRSAKDVNAPINADLTDWVY